MPDYADLELSLHRRDGAAYTLELRFSRPDSDADIRFSPAEARFDWDALGAQAFDPVAYGQALSRGLFADPSAQAALAQARAATQSATPAMSLRLRLLIGPSASELHSLRWETLRDPHSGTPLCSDENLLFSRYLSSLDWRPVRLRPQSDLSALLVVANPSNLASYKLAPVDVSGEHERARAGLGRIAIAALPSETARATLNNILDALRDGQADILYLACHGSLVKGEPWLWLEDDAGQVARASGNELATRIQELAERPRLVVLASCQSAGTGAGDALTALGPRLAEAGIPAVLAMQGNISMETVARFMPQFFSQLQRDGQIDRALAVARGAVRERDDAWMPALFTRLKSGRIWYVPGFGSGNQEFEHWESLKTFIQEKTCTPIIGPGLAEPLLGQASEIARRWAEKHGYPFAPYDLEDLPRIAQYIQRREGPKYLQSAFNKALREELVRRFSAVLPDTLLKSEVWTPDKILKALEIAAEQSWSSDGAEGHHQLAELRLPIYITTSPSNLLAQALTKAGTTPQVRLCPWWSQRIPESKWRYEDEPTEEQPLIYHMFGHIGTPESIVLSEDNHFDFLIGVMRNRDLIPDTVINALTSTALLFIGFRTDEWAFRVMFRTLMAQEGSEQLRDYTHVTAQIEPDEGRLLDFGRARRYLEKAFTKDNIGVFWGRSDEFLNELSKHMRAS
jgi:hypothetical protein